ncbi:S66 family peptidase [Natronobeatus ordinarius]|uniref:S66 family peptidase n=1 Tax=Natronobeatus ordinarius TaxID=2963433 RepID=UPI0020CD0D5B|nr:S66 peptidase family protein [Natronobeatus ordinarius]
MRAPVTPPPLERGDRVAIVAPASNSALEFPHVYERGLGRLETVFDLEPVEFPTVSKGRKYLYDHPEERAQDVMDAFEDPEIRGVVTVIGGNDQVRILEHLEPDVLREHPTRFYGYSDNAHLASYLWNLGIVSFAGPSVMTELAMDSQMFELTVEYVERAFFDDSLGELRPAEAFTDEPGDWADPDALEQPRETEPNPGWTWTGGDGPVEGRIWGGCLEILDQLFLADRFAPPDDDLEGTILAFETSEEIPDPAWVAGVLRALGERGLLERFAGVLVGRPPARSHLEDRPPEWRKAYRDRQREVISSVVAEYNPDAPVVLDVDFGHTYPTIPIPIGGRVEIDPGTETVAFD